MILTGTLQHIRNHLIQKIKHHLQQKRDMTHSFNQWFDIISDFYLLISFKNKMQV